MNTIKTMTAAVALLAVASTAPAHATWYMTPKCIPLEAVTNFAMAQTPEQLITWFAQSGIRVTDETANQPGGLDRNTIRVLRGPFGYGIAITDVELCMKLAKVAEEAAQR